jgi:hypothetical protein
MIRYEIGKTSEDHLLLFLDEVISACCNTVRCKSNCSFLCYENSVCDVYNFVRFDEVLIEEVNKTI